VLPRADETAVSAKTVKRRARAVPLTGETDVHVTQARRAMADICASPAEQRSRLRKRCRTVAATQMATSRLKKSRR